MLINAERFIMSLDFKSKWEIQAEEMEKKYDKLFSKSIEMKRDVIRLEEKLEA